MELQKELSVLRKEIDEIDRQIVPLFLKRMSVALKIGELKGKNNISVLDAERERQVVEQALSMAGDSLKDETALFMRTIIALSREYQLKMLDDNRTEPEGNLRGDLK